MKKFFMAVIALMMTVSVSAQFYIYLNTGEVLKADSISMVEPSPSSIPLIGTSDYYSNGREPVFDLDDSTVNGIAFDNTTKHCWKYTTKITTLGITATTTEYMWGTEFSLVATCEENMYGIAHTGDSRGSYYYVMVTGTDEDACTQLSEAANN